MEQSKTFKSFLTEILNGGSGAFTANVLSSVQQTQSRLMKIKRGWEEEAETSVGSTAPKIDIARSIYQQLVNAPNSSRKQIIHTMMRRAGVTHSTAVSYYERIAKEAGHTNKDIFGKRGASIGAMGSGMNSQSPQVSPEQATQQMPMFGQQDQEEQPQEEKELIHTFPDDPNRQGIIRHVDKAHLVYKKQTPDGTFEELWSYNIGPDMQDELSIRRNILSGTDIPAQKTRSLDGSQSYSLTTLGNGQLLHVSGLPN